MDIRFRRSGLRWDFQCGGLIVTGPTFGIIA